MKRLYIAVSLFVSMLSAFPLPLFAEGYFEYNKTKDGDIIINDGGNTIDVQGAITSSNGATAVNDDRKVVTTAGSRVALASSTASKTVFITALLSNTDVVVVGGSTVVAAAGTRRGTPLSAGDSIVISIDDISKVYIDSVVNGEGVSFTYTS